MSELALIVAMSPRGVIGQGGGLPWHIPEDLKHFRKVTTGHAVIMGRRTHRSIGRPLPNRRNIVVSREPGLRIEGCEVAESFEAALDLARQTDNCPIVIGGASLYAAALPLATRLYITEVARDVPGDTFFPSFDRTAFREVDRSPAETEPDVTFVTLARDRVVGSGPER